jgi:hypothetical protein
MQLRDGEYARFARMDRELIAALDKAFRDENEKALARATLEDDWLRLKANCSHCINGWFQDQRFGADVECINGILIDIDVYMEGFSPDVCYYVAPCHPHWNDQCNDIDFPDDSQERLTV